MKTKLKYLLTGLLLLVVSMTFAQGTYLGGTYSMSVPMSGISNYISSTSFRGVNFEGLKDIKGNIAVGWVLGWNTFSEKRANEVYVQDNVTLTGTQYRYKNLFPLLARGVYQIGGQEGTRPYIGAGLGVTPDITRTVVGVYSFEETAWHFTMAPEAGIIIPFGYTSFTANVRYVYGFKAGELGMMSFLSLNLGLLWGE